MPCNFMELYTFQSILIYNIHLSTDFQKRLILKLRQTMLVLKNALLLFNTICSKNCCLESWNGLFCLLSGKRGWFPTKAKDGFFASTCSFIKVTISILLLNYQLFQHILFQICQADLRR